MGGFNIVNTAMLPNLSTDIIPSKLPADLCAGRVLILKFIRKCKRSKITRTTLKKKKFGGLTLPSSKSSTKL
jgi:hypothetical protein